MVDPVATAPLLACRLNKCPGVRPIGIGDTSRRIIAKAILTITKGDIQEATGSIQLCAGQISGTETAVHTAQALYHQDETEAILLVDASNAFNSLNRLVALHNIRHLCPSLATVLINTYRAPTKLFVDGSVLYSREGTTQGDPLAMPMYALATLPLIKELKSIKNVKQVWYADDASSTGKIKDLYEWWKKLTTLGPRFGYSPNAMKTWLVTKEEHLTTATTQFANEGVNITSEGRPYLGAALGKPEFVSSYVRNKVQSWCSIVDKLSSIAAIQPHAAYAAFTHGLSNKWTYLLRTISGIGNLFEPLESEIRTKLIPKLTGQSPPNDDLRHLLSLPARLGGLAITNPTSIATSLQEAVIKQSMELLYEINKNQK